LSLPPGPGAPHAQALQRGEPGRRNDRGPL